MNLRELSRALFTAAVVLLSAAANGPLAAAEKSGTDPVRWFDNSTGRVEKFTIGSVDRTTGYKFAVELSSEDAAIITVKLSEHFATDDDKRLYGKDPDGYERARLANPEKYKGHYSVMNPVIHRGRQHLALATRRVDVSAPGRREPLPKLVQKSFWRRVESSLPSSATADSISFERKLYLGKEPAEAMDNPILRVIKTYTVRRGSNSIEVSVQVENLSDMPLKVSLDQRGPTGLSREDYRSDMRKAAYGKLDPADQKVQVMLKPSSELKSMKLGVTVELGSSTEPTAQLWIGHVNKFFGSMMYLIPAVPDRLEAPSYRAKFYVSPAEESDTSRTFLTGVKIPDIELRPGQSRQVRFDLFAGPKKRSLLSGDEAPELYKKLNYLSTIDFGGCFCTFNWLSLSMMWLLDTLSTVAMGNYGLAIIMLVILVRIALHPLTKKGQISMMKMQKFGPQMQKLKEKYADDKDTLNKEMMKFYKTKGATPILGCLPMFLQMPIWIALWTGLNAAVELRHSAFLPVWITDLAAPDALFSWSDKLPVIGNTFNLLPLLLTVAMFLQTKFNPQMAQASASTDDAQKRQQQKMMQYMMPAMMLFIFYNAPSGLTLYIMSSTFAGVAEQFIIRKHIKSKEAAAATVETTVQLPGRGLRDGRPKKPKGPLWTKRS